MIATLNFSPFYETTCKLVESSAPGVETFASRAPDEPHPIYPPGLPKVFRLVTMELLTGLGATHLHMACFPGHSLLFSYS